MTNSTQPAQIAPVQMQPAAPAPAPAPVQMQAPVYTQDAVPAPAPVQAPAPAPEQPFAPMPQTSQPAMPAVDSNMMPVASTDGFNDLLDEIKDDVGSGSEEVDESSITYPYIILLQATSPVVVNAVDNNRPDIKAGLFYNTLSQEVYKSLVFLPCHFQRRFMRYDGDGRGNYVCSYPAAQVATGRIPGVIRNNLDYQIKDGLGLGTLVDTRIHYVLYLNPNTQNFEPAILSLTRTQIKASKKLSSLIKLSELTINGRVVTNPPAWCFAYRADVDIARKDNNSWYAWSFSRLGPNYPELYHRAKALYESVKNIETNSPAPNEEEAMHIIAQQHQHPSQQGYQQPVQGYQNPNMYQQAPDYSQPQQVYHQPVQTAQPVQAYQQANMYQQQPYMGAQYQQPAQAPQAPVYQAEQAIPKDGDDIPF